MKRTIERDLLAWKERPHRKPLILKGARQVGKTWILRDFAERHYKNVLYYDLLANERVRSIFDTDFNIERILRELSIEAGVEIDPSTTLIILDEIQESPRALTALKYFNQERPDIHIASAGSYLGIASHRDASYPVGHVDTLTLHPLTFEEFLDASGNSLLSAAINEGGAEATEVNFSSRATDLLKHYLFVGGMPAVVNIYCDSGDFREVRRVQGEILENYDADFSKHAPVRILERMRMVWSSVGGQLGKENKKFIYGALRSGARARDFEESIQWLVDYGVIGKVCNLRAARIPLDSYAYFQHFKIFLLDVGLLGALVRVPERILLDGDALFTEFKGALTEQYVYQQLRAKNFVPYYWSAEKGDAEVDFVIEHDGSVFPIEVKAAENVKAKSLAVMQERYSLPRGIRFSLAGYRKQERLTNIPLWAMQSFESYVE